MYINYLSISQNLISERDVERERMRRELIASRERLHQQLTHGYTTNTNTSTTATTTTTITTYNDPTTTTSTTTTTTCNDPTAAARDSRPSSLISGNSSTDMDEGKQGRNRKFEKKERALKKDTV